MASAQTANGISYLYHVTFAAKEKFILTWKRRNITFQFRVHKF